MKKFDNSKLMVYLTFLISVLLAIWFYHNNSADLKHTLQQSDDEMYVLTMMDHLDKLNTSITYIERNEKPFILANSPVKSEEIEYGYQLARSEMDSLRAECNNQYFNCRDIYKLDSFITNKIIFSKQIVSLSKNGHPDKAIKLLTLSIDSAIMSGFIAQYNIVYDQGKEYVLKFQDNHTKETLKDVKNSNLITTILLVCMFLICWRLLFQIKQKDKILAQKRIYADIINNSTESVITTNANFEITYCNQATEHIFKIKAGSLIGLNPDEAFHSADSEEAKMHRYQSLETNGNWSGEIPCTDSEGKRVHFLTTINSIKGKTGETIGYFAISTNIGRQKRDQFEISQLANSLKANNESLEIKVKEQTKLIKEIFERVDDVFIGFDKDLKVIYTNKSAEPFLGLSESAIKAVDIISVLSSITSLDMSSKLKNSFSRQQTISTEFYSKNGGFYYKIEIYPSINGLSILIKNITKQKKAEEQIKKSARLYKLFSTANETIIHAKSEEELFSNICNLSVDNQDIIFSWVGTVDKTANKVNPIISVGYENGYLEYIKEITIDNSSTGNGPSAKAFKEGKSYYSNDIENDPNMQIWKEAALERGYRSSISLPIKLNNKSYAIIALYASKPFYFTSEEITLLEQVAENVSFAIQSFYIDKLRAASEQQLNKLSQAIEQSSVAVIISDLNGKIEYVNHAFEKLTGFSMDEVISKNSKVLNADNPFEEIQKELKQNKLYNKVWTNEFMNKKKDGEFYWEQDITSCFSDLDGVIKNYVTVKVDITERKKLEESQIQMTQDLFQRNTNLEQFSYILSHNIRGPLSNILGLTEALKFDLKNEERQVLLESIDKSAHTMDLVIKDVAKILQYRNLQAEVQVDISFKRLISEIREDLSYLITKKNATIYTDFSAAQNYFSLRSYLRSIFFNLITNALKFSKSEIPVKIEIRTEIQNNSLLIICKDYGMGIDLSRHGNKMFGLYKRLNLDIEGRGIGLFLIKTQVEHLHGKISVDSILGEWTEFKIELPMNGFQGAINSN